MICPDNELDCDNVGCRRGGCQGRRPKPPLLHTLSVGTVGVCLCWKRRSRAGQGRCKRPIAPIRAPVAAARRRVRSPGLTSLGLTSRANFAVPQSAPLL